MEDYNNHNGHDRGEREDVFSKVVRAGKRTYFFDVKATRHDEFYLTITESKKRLGNEGRFFYEKHKIFLYQEDFENFIDGLNEVVQYIKSNQDENIPLIDENAENSQIIENEFSNISFDDLEGN